MPLEIQPQKYSLNKSKPITRLCDFSASRNWFNLLQHISPVIHHQMQPEKSIKKMFVGRMILLIFIYSLPVVSIAQNKQIDSLRKLLIATSDTAKVNLLNQLARQYAIASEFEEAKAHAEQALALAEKIKFKPGVTRSYGMLGNIFHNEGTKFHSQGNFAEALKRYFIALKYREKIQDKEQMAKSSGNIGLIHWHRYNYPEALKYMFISLRYFEDCKSKIGIAGTYNNIGLISVLQKNYTVAMKYYESAMNLYKELDDRASMVNLYFNMGFLNEDRMQYQDAINYHQAAMKICEGMNNIDGVAASLTNMGGAVLLLAKGQKDEKEKKQQLMRSLDYQNQSLKLYKELNETWSYTNVNIQIAKVYLELEDFITAKRSLEEALKYKDEASIYDTKETYELLGRVDSALGDWHAAYEDQKQFIFFRDSIVNDENTKKITQAQLQYGFDKMEDSLKYQQQLMSEKLQKQIILSQQREQSLLLNEQQLDLLNKEKQLQQLKIQKNEADIAFQKSEAGKKQNQFELLTNEKELQSTQLKKQRQLKNFLFAAIACTIIISFVVYRNYRIRQQLKLQTLRNKIASDLHDDVGSTLSSISIFSQVALEESKEVKPMLQTIGESSRKMLDAMADIVWTISPENDQFEKIILRMRSFAYELLGAKQMDFRFVADENIAKMKISMEARRNLYLIFKEATNNMVKYSGASKAMFHLKEEKGKLVMMITDNGKGFDNNLEFQGNGLKNMKKRASEMGALLVVDSVPGTGTMIKLELAV